MNACCVLTACSDDGSTNTISGAAKVKDPAEPAKLEVSFSGSKKRSQWTSSAVPRAPNPSDSHPSHSSSPRPLLGALFRLWGSLSGLRLHRLRHLPHGAELDPEQRAHHARGDPGEPAQHPHLHRRGREQDGPHQPGPSLLQCHELLSSSSSSYQRCLQFSVMFCQKNPQKSRCIKPVRNRCMLNVIFFT